MSGFDIPAIRVTTEKGFVMKNYAGTTYISHDAKPQLMDLLRSMGRSIMTVPALTNVAAPIAGHPDIQMCRMGVPEPAGCAGAVEEALPAKHWTDAPLFVPAPEELAQLTEKYPSDVAFCAACTGKYFLHNLKFTHPRLLSVAEQMGMRMIHVRQGYAKCSTVIVDRDSIITYDRGIAAPAEAAGMSVLLIRPGHIHLPGYDTGFIGGASGRVDDAVIFNGNLMGHPDGAAIRDFVLSRGLRCLWLEQFSLSDIGSIL